MDIETQRVKLQIESYFSALTRNVIVESEFAQSLTLALTEIQEDGEITGYLARIPETAKPEFIKLLSKIRDQDYFWHPFFLGPGLSDAEVEKQRIPLIRIDRLFSELSKSSNDPGCIGG